jgi:hypothetical protein
MTEQKNSLRTREKNLTFLQQEKNNSVCELQEINNVTNNTTIPNKKFDENQRKKTLTFLQQGKNNSVCELQEINMIINGGKKPSKGNSDSKVVVLERLSVSHVARLHAGRWDDFSSDHFRR